MKSASTYILRECGVERMIDVPFDFDIEGAKLLRNIIGIMFCLETPEMLEKVITDLREGTRLRGSSALRLEEIIAELEQKEKDAASEFARRLVDTGLFMSAGGNQDEQEAQQVIGKVAVQDSSVVLEFAKNATERIPVVMRTVRKVLTGFRKAPVIVLRFGGRNEDRIPLETNKRTVSETLRTFLESCRTTPAPAS